MGDDDGSNFVGQKKSSYSDTAKRQEYLLLLQERNRLKKMITSKTVVERENEEKERGFSTHFRGANAQKVADLQHRTIKRGTRKFSAGTSASKLGNVVPVLEGSAESASVPARRGWAVGRPKFLFGVRLEDQQQTQSGPNLGNSDANSARRSKISLEDDGDEDEGVDNDENYDDYLDDFDEYGVNDDFEGSDGDENPSASMKISVVSGKSDGTLNDQYQKIDQYQNNTVTTDSSFLEMSASMLAHQSKPPSPVESSSGVPVFSNSRISSRGSGGSLSKMTDAYTSSKKYSRDSLQKVENSITVSDSIHSNSNRGGDNSTITPKNAFRDVTEAFGVTSSCSPDFTDIPSVMNDQQNIISKESSSQKTIRLSPSSSSIRPPQSIQPTKEDPLDNVANPPLCPLKSAICIRIRIHNTWKKSKFVSLEAVRLTYRNISEGHLDNENISNRGDRDNSNIKLDYNNEKNNYWIDLRTFTVKVMSGVEQLSSSSETVRSIQHLLGNSSIATQGLGLGPQNSAVKNTWKGPMNLGNPLDIYLEGNLPEEYSRMYCDEEAMMNSLQLHIWNLSSMSSSSSSSGTKGENADNSSLLSSAAKDVDIYLGSSCVWSGTIKEENDLETNQNINQSCNQKNSSFFSGLSTRNSNNNKIQIGKFIENNLMAVFGPNRNASEIILLKKKNKIKTKKVEDKVENNLIGQREGTETDFISASNNVRSLEENDCNGKSGNSRMFISNPNSGRIPPKSRNREDDNEINDAPPAWLLGLKPKSVSTSNIPLRDENENTLHPSKNLIPHMQGMSSQAFSEKVDPRVGSDAGPHPQSNNLSNSPQETVTVNPLFSVVNDLKFVKDKNRISSANGRRRKKVCDDEENVLREDSVINNLNEESGEEEIDSMTNLSPINSEHLNLSASARRLRRKGAPSPSNLILLQNLPAFKNIEKYFVILNYLIILYPS